MGSMGADAADLDNDSNPDIMVTEMLPKTIERQRTKTLFESWNKYDMAFWDNRCTLHKAIWDYHPMERKGRRVTIKGTIPY